MGDIRFTAFKTTAKLYGAQTDAHETPTVRRAHIHQPTNSTHTHARAQAAILRLLLTDLPYNQRGAAILYSWRSCYRSVSHRRRLQFAVAEGSRRQGEQNFYIALAVLMLWLVSDQDRVLRLRQGNKL